jgi:CRISPR-associated protein Cas2
MAINAPRLHLICYDIANPKRLGRVYRYLTTRATPLQYSVFVANLRRRDLSDIIREVNTRIDLGEDDVRIYPLPQSLRVAALGQSYFPEGTTLIERGIDLLNL